MGYRIEYDGYMAKRKRIRITRQKKRVAAVVAVLACVLGLVAWPKSRAVVMDILIPGDDQVTASAWEGLVEDLQEGEPFVTALEAFCREIIYAE